MLHNRRCFRSYPYNSTDEYERPGQRKNLLSARRSWRTDPTKENMPNNAKQDHALRYLFRIDAFSWVCGTEDRWRRRKCRKWGILEESKIRGRWGFARSMPRKAFPMPSRGTKREIPSKKAP